MPGSTLRQVGGRANARSKPKHGSNGKGATKPKPSVPRSSHARSGAVSDDSDDGEAALPPRLAGLDPSKRAEALLALSGSAGSLFSAPREIGKAPPSAPGASYAEDGPPEAVRLLSAAVAKKRRAAAAKAAAAAAAAARAEKARTIAGRRGDIFHDDGRDSDSEDGDAGHAEFDLTEAEAAALGWQYTQAVLQGMGAASDLTTNRSALRKQNRHVRKTLSQVQRRVQRTMEEFRARTAALGVEVDSDDEDILGSSIRDSLTTEAKQAVAAAHSGAEAYSYSSKRDLLEALAEEEGRAAAAGGGVAAPQGAGRPPRAQHTTSAETPAAPSKAPSTAHSTGGTKSKARRVAMARGAALARAKLGGRTPALPSTGVRESKEGGRPRRARGRTVDTDDDDASSVDEAAEAAALDRMFGVGENLEADIAEGKRALRDATEGLVAATSSARDRRKWVVRRARREIQELLQMRAARAAAQSDTLEGVLSELRQYHSVDQRGGAEPAPVSALASYDVTRQAVERDIESTQDTLWRDTRSLASVFGASRELFKKLIVQAADGASATKLRGEVEAMNQALASHGETIEKLLSKLHMTEQRLQRAQRTQAGKATRLELLERKDREHEALMGTLRAEIEAKESAMETLRSTLASLRSTTVGHSVVDDLASQLTEAQERAAAAEAEAERKAARVEELQEQVLRLRTEAAMSEGGGGTPSSGWVGARCTPGEMQSAIDGLAAMLQHCQWAVKEACLVLHRSSRMKVAHVFAPALIHLRDSQWRKDVERSVGADSLRLSLAAGSDEDLRVAKGWFFDQETAFVRSPSDLVDLLNSLPGPEHSLGHLNLPDTPRTAGGRSITGASATSGGSGEQGAGSPQARPQAFNFPPSSLQATAGGGDGGAGRDSGGGPGGPVPPVGATVRLQGDSDSDGDDAAGRDRTMSSVGWADELEEELSPKRSSGDGKAASPGRRRPRRRSTRRRRGSKHSSSSPTRKRPPQARPPGPQGDTQGETEREAQAEPATGPRRAEGGRPRVEVVRKPSDVSGSRRQDGQSPSRRVGDSGGRGNALQGGGDGAGPDRWDAGESDGGGGDGMRVEGRGVGDGVGQEHGASASSLPRRDSYTVLVPPQDAADKGVTPHPPPTQRRHGVQTSSRELLVAAGGDVPSPKGGSPPIVQSSATLRRRHVEQQPGSKRITSNSAGGPPRDAGAGGDTTPVQGDTSAPAEQEVAEDGSPALANSNAAEGDAMEVDASKLGVTFGGSTAAAVVTSLQSRVRSADALIARLHREVQRLRRKQALLQTASRGGILEEGDEDSSDGSAPDFGRGQGGSGLEAASSTARPGSEELARPTAPVPPLAGEGGPDGEQFPALEQLSRASEALVDAAGKVLAAAASAGSLGSALGHPGAEGGAHGAARGPTPDQADPQPPTAEQVLGHRSSVLSALQDVAAVLREVTAQRDAYRAARRSARRALSQAKADMAAQVQAAVHDTKREVGFALQSQLMAHVQRLEEQFRRTLRRCVRRLGSWSGSRAGSPRGSARAEQGDAGDSWVSRQGSSSVTRLDTGAGGAQRTSRPLLVSPPEASGAPRARHQAPDTPPSTTQRQSSRPSAFGSFVQRRRAALGAAVQVPEGKTAKAPRPTSPGKPGVPSGGERLFKYHKGRPTLRVSTGEGQLPSTIGRVGAVSRGELQLQPMAPATPAPLLPRADRSQLRRLATTTSSAATDPGMSTSHFVDTTGRRRHLASLPTSRQPAQQAPSPPTDAMMGGAPSPPTPGRAPSAAAAHGLVASPVALVPEEGGGAPPGEGGSPTPFSPTPGTLPCIPTLTLDGATLPRGGSAHTPKRPVTFATARAALSPQPTSGYASDGAALPGRLSAHTRLIHRLVLAGNTERGIYNFLKAKFEPQAALGALLEGHSPPHPAQAAQVDSVEEPVTTSPPSTSLAKAAAGSGGPVGDMAASGRSVWQDERPRQVQVQSEPATPRRLPATATGKLELLRELLEALPPAALPSLHQAAQQAPGAGSGGTPLSRRGGAGSPLRAASPTGHPRAGSPLYTAGALAGQDELSTAPGRSRRGRRLATMQALWTLLRWQDKHLAAHRQAAMVERWAALARRSTAQRRVHVIAHALATAEAAAKDPAVVSAGPALAEARREVAALQSAKRRAEAALETLQALGRARRDVLASGVRRLQGTVLGVLSRLAGGTGQAADRIPLLDPQSPLASTYLAEESVAKARQVTPVPPGAQDVPFVHTMPLRHRPHTAPGPASPSQPDESLALSAAPAEPGDDILPSEDVVHAMAAVPPVLALPTASTPRQGQGALQAHARTAWQRLLTHLHSTVVDEQYGTAVQAEPGTAHHGVLAPDLPPTPPVLLSLAQPTLPAVLGGVQGLWGGGVHARSILPRDVITRLAAAVPFLPLGGASWATMPLWGRTRLLLDVVEYAVLGTPPRVAAAQRASLSQGSGVPTDAGSSVAHARHESHRDPWANVSYSTFGLAAVPGHRVRESAGAADAAAAQSASGEGSAETYADFVNAAAIAAGPSQQHALVSAAESDARSGIARLQRPTAASRGQSGEKSRQAAFARALVVKHSQDVEVDRQTMLAGVAGGAHCRGEDDPSGRVAEGTVAAVMQGTAAGEGLEAGAHQRGAPSSLRREHHSRGTSLESGRRGVGQGPRSAVLSRQGMAVEGTSTAADVAVTHLQAGDEEGGEELAALRKHHARPGP